MDIRQIDFIWICPDWASIFLVNFKLGDSAVGYVQRQSHKSGDANDTFLVWSFIVVKALDGYMVVCLDEGASLSFTIANGPRLRSFRLPVGADAHHFHGADLLQDFRFPLKVTSQQMH
jgi:hypothetical protein